MQDPQSLKNSDLGMAFSTSDSLWLRIEFLKIRHSLFCDIRALLRWCKGPVLHQQWQCCVTTVQYERIDLQVSLFLADSDKLCISEGEHQAWSEDEQQIVGTLLIYSICNLLEMANYSFNFYVYCIYNRNSSPCSFSATNVSTFMFVYN